jgi:hypothetical protein
MATDRWQFRDTALGRALYPRRAWIALGLCVLLSLGGIVVVDQPGNAGRGGAVAVAVALFILFCSETPGLSTFSLVAVDAANLKTQVKELRELMDEKVTTVPIETRVQNVEIRIDRVCKAFLGCQTINERALSRNNILLAIGSAIGTLAWGFGDIAHKWLFA